MQSDDTLQWLKRGQEALAHSQWAVGAHCFGLSVQRQSHHAGAWHNLGVCLSGLGRWSESAHACQQALAIQPTLWQSQLILGKAYKMMDDPLKAEVCYKAILASDKQNPQARIALADIYMNTFGQPLAAMDWVKPISDSIEHAEDAALTTLMAGLYDRDTSAEHHNQQILAFAKRALQMDTNAFWQGLGRPVPQHTAWPMPSDAKWRPRSGRQRPRVALMSPMLSVTPVYFLTIAGWRHIAKGCDLVVFNRGHLNDWATQAFRQLAVEWHDVQELNAQQLATQLVHADLDVLYDMGGWSDPVGLKALSVKPVLQMFKWVGGQSVTTGLTCFDGWIGDPWQSPLTLQHLFTEPLINIAQGYAVYTPPDYLPSPPRLKRDMPVVFANPAKLSRAFLRELQAIPGKKCLLHKQFKFAPARAQVLKFLPEHDVEFVTPNSHREALEVLGQHKIMLDTFPYSSGLTAHEANAMGVKVKARAGTLFCERHSARLIDGLIS